MKEELDLTSVNPLNAEHLDGINKALDYIDVGIKRIELARRAGIEMPEKEKELLDMRKKLNAIKQVYFPAS